MDRDGGQGSTQGVKLEQNMIELETHCAAKQLDLAKWPTDGLESLKACPVCESSQRRVLYDEMRDKVFFCAPGEWVLHECMNCGSSYLDPRPTPATIYLAYRTYYTHQRAERIPTATLRGVKYLKRIMANGYRNWRFNADFSPSNSLGVLLAFLLPSERTAIEHESRHLPRRPQYGRLLDIGFGDGAFLDIARAMGWDVTGIDPDSKVVNNALQRGLNVYQGGLEVMAQERGAFDVITMSHVIEHVHDPIEVLQTCNRLLKPGGQLWIETPNINSLGRSRFQHSWRGLETPRHLVLFNGRSLRGALQRAGFTNVQDVSQTSPCSVIYSMSQRIEAGLDPYVETPTPAWLRFEIIMARFAEFWLKPRREFLSVTAKKPDSDS
jgi:2-polyprenyl-3-methyl-5-hydroxy-6-metoxy-1,4-benzoquinol methylase